MVRRSALACVALVAVTLTSAQPSQTSSPPTSQGESPATHSHASAASTAKSSKSTGASRHSTASKTRKSRKPSTTRRARGQQKIDPQRTLQIQEALIREHYLEGKPTGVWNDATQQAMQRYQADNNWQSKTTPDARALIKLGLGPDHDHLLNPESAMTSQPEPAHASSVTPPGAPNSDKQQR